MKEYKVLEHPGGEIEAVNIGWSWPAFFFSGLWALVKRLWVLGGIYFLLFFILGFISEVSGKESKQSIDVSIGIVQIIISIVFGVLGNKWREKNLLLNGFNFKRTVKALSQDEAVHLYLKEMK